MIEMGIGKPHHGHEPDAVKGADALQKADDDAVAAKAAADEDLAEKAAQAAADKRAAQDARHKAEIEAKKFVSKRPKK